MTLRTKRSLCRALLSFAAAFATFTLPVTAATINVPTTATPTIQSGIDAASNGDTVLVAPGTYFENIDFKGKAIQVVAADAQGGINSGGAADTIIDGGGKGPAVTFASGESASSRLVGFTIQHGGGSAGINIQNGDSQVTAGIVVLNSSPTILGDTITRNNCYGVLIENASPNISASTISNTDGTPGQWCDYVAIGTGILVDGALASNATSQTPIYPTILNNIIENNIDQVIDASSSGGGGIHVLVGQTYIADNTIRNNFSQQSGGGIAISHYNPSFDPVNIVGNLIYGNSSACGGGGLAFNQNTAAGYGAPVYFIYNNTIVDNTNTNNCQDGQHADGSQVYLWQDSNRFVFVNNIIAGNSGTFSAFYCETMRQQLPQYQLAIFDHNDLYNAQGAVMTGHCLDPSGDFYGNIAADPLFKDRANADYHLTAASPAIDTGNNAAVSLLTLDRDGKPRQQDVTGVDFPIVDMGVYEFPQTTTPPNAPVFVTIAPQSYTYNVGDLSEFDLDYTQAGSPYDYGEGYMYEDGKFSFGASISSDGTLIIGHTELNAGLHAYVAKLPRFDGLELATTIKLFLIINEGAVSSTTTLASSANPATVGQSVTFTATVTAASGTPTGTVTFTDGTTTLGTQTLVNGVATYTTSTLAVGTHTISAAYNPGATAFSASNATLSQVINGLPTATSLTVAPTAAVYGSSIAMTATVNFFGSSNSTGGITFFDGATAIATGELLPGSSTSSLNYAYLTVGTHIITAVYSGDATHNASTSTPVTVTITAATTTLSLAATPNPALALQPITLTANLTGTSSAAAGNTIVFSANGKSFDVVYGPVITNAQGIATLTVSLPAGTYTLGASFAGNANVSPATAPPVVEVVNPNPTTATLYAQPNPGYQNTNETLTASISTEFSTGPIPPIPTGTVTFFDAGAPIATSPLDAKGQATFSTTAFTVGNHALSAVYNGTANFLASTSRPYTLAILARDFTLTTEPTITIQTQHHKTLAFTLDSIGNFTDIVALSCGKMPESASCTFPSNAPLLAAGSTLPSTVRIDTDAVYNYLSSTGSSARTPTHPRLRNAIAFALMLPITLLAATRRRRALRRTIKLFASLSIFLIATTFTGCSGHYPGHTPPGTYSITITGQGATTHITHTATVTLIVTE